MQRETFLLGVGSSGVALFAFRRGAFAIEPVPATVRVRIFAALELDAADISGVHLDASSQPTAVSAHGGPLSVVAHRTDGTTIERRYGGEIRSSSIDGKLALVNVVDLESYVASVLASEISAGWHPETLKAQAVAVRTYALRRTRHKHPASFDVVDDTSNQVYRGLDGIAPSLAAAGAATTGQVLVFDGLPADVWYHSACGGHTAASAEVSGAAAPAYLRGAPDVDAGGRAFCSISPYFTWRNTLTAEAIARVVGIDPSTLSALSIADRWGDGRARTIRVTSLDGDVRDVDGHAFYSRAGAVLGYKVVPSALFDIASNAHATYVFSGHGNGHGVGMCQWGAEGRARAGQNAASILAAYFPGTAVAALT